MSAARTRRSPFCGRGVVAANSRIGGQGGLAAYNRVLPPDDHDRIRMTAPDTPGPSAPDDFPPTTVPAGVADTSDDDFSAPPDLWSNEVPPVLSSAPPLAAPSPTEGFDRRVYIPDAEGWQARIKHGWDNDYCYAKSPGQDYFHLLLNGEIYIQKEHEKFCLNCAVRLGLVTTDRLYWQNGPRPPRPTPL